MNQYYNYKKWRLARFISEQHPNIIAMTSGDGSKNQPIKGEISKSLIDSRTTHPIQGYISHDEDNRYQEDIEGYPGNQKQHIIRGVNKVLHDLRYVTPSTYHLPPPVRIIKNPNVGSELTRETPGRHTISSEIYTLKRDLPMALAHYAGSIFQDILAGYASHNIESEFKRNPYLHNQATHPALDKMEELGIHNSLEDIPYSSPFHYDRVQVDSDNQDLEPESVHAHRKDGPSSQFQRKMEDLALILGYRGGAKYFKYLPTASKETFEEFLERTQDDIEKNEDYDKEKLWHEFILQLVRGEHLKD